jgi:hypothetical protein
MTAAVPRLFLFDPAKAASTSRHRRTDAATTAGPERRLHCIACRQLVTRLDERISVNGAAEHTVRNPYGIEFHIGCFKSAYGCRAHGAPTRAHTWFPGYAWRLALCARCGLHLGWLYRGDTDGFHGLILNRLTTAANSASA